MGVIEGARRAAVVLMTGWVVALTSCAWMGNSQGTPGSTAASASHVPASPVFYDFTDIPVPADLSLQKDESSVFLAGNVKAGVLVFKGRVEPSSLINFFQVSLTRENWHLMGSSRYRKSILLFDKDQRSCVITIGEGRFSTQVVIYVIPKASPSP